MPLIATRGAASVQGFGEFAQTTAPVYIEDVFSTWLYTGNSSTQTITNNIDLSGKGGMTWIKCRNAAGTNNAVFDTLRGATKRLFTDLTDAQDTSSTSLTAFTSSGFTLGSNGNQNNSGDTFASWTFREQLKFFDVVTYTGNGSNRTISHNLGSVPGCIIVKRTDTTGAWAVYHRSLANTEYLVLNTTAAKATGTTYWNSTTPTSTVFSLGTATDVNANSGTYVAYLFAHNAGGFGTAGDQNIVSCGTYSGSGVAGNAINLGYEPQWVMIKSYSLVGSNWNIFDNMRGVASGGEDARLLANTTGAESSSSNFIKFTSTGFELESGNDEVNGTEFYIYIAIRRGPMKTPTSGTSVFTPVASRSSGTSQATPIFNAGFPVDWLLTGIKSGGGVYSIPRLTVGQLETFSAAAETSVSSTYNFGGMLGVLSNAGDLTNANVCGWNFRRAPGFFDVVCYTGTGSSRTVTHNLGVTPELMLVKNRSEVYDWRVYSAETGGTKYLILNSTAAAVTSSGAWNDTAPTSSVFTVGDSLATNKSGNNIVAYLFASVSGVSKVGSYTGTGALQTVNCGFTGGARFVLIKRTDSTGDWWVYDSARGISSGNDPYLFLNSTAAEVTGTNYVDTTSVGFQVTAAAPAGLNANGGTYIFLAIA